MKDGGTRAEILADGHLGDDPVGRGADELDAEQLGEGQHLFLYPFAGRYVHIGLGSLLAWRLARDKPNTFSISINDYGLELLSAEPVETPPALIMQGTADDNLTPEMAANFAAAYTKAGGSIVYHSFADQPHAFIARDPAAPDALRALGLIADFVHRHTR